MLAPVASAGRESDRELPNLVLRARSGDKRALRQIYDRYSAPIHRFLLGLTKSVPAAHDATQETFARAFIRLDSLSDPELLSAWLFGIARRVALESWKAARRGPPCVAGEFEGECSQGDTRDRSTPESILLGREAASIVDRAMSRLSEDRRTVLLLRVDHGLGYEAIAEIMEWSLSKAKVEVHRARLELRAEMATYEQNEGVR